MRHTRTGPAGGLLEGWRLVGVVSVVLVTAVVVLALAAGGGIDGVRLAIRTTARTSIALFLLAFTASSLAALLPTPFTAWQLRNRRYLGVSFAVSHLIHAVAIVLLLRWDAALFWTLTNPVNIGTGGLAYAVILAMAATSFDRTAAWLGPRALARPAPAGRLVHLGELPGRLRQAHPGERRRLLAAGRGAARRPCPAPRGGAAPAPRASAGVRPASASAGLHAAAGSERSYRTSRATAFTQVVGGVRKAARRTVFAIGGKAGNVMQFALSCLLP